MKYLESDVMWYKTVLFSHNVCAGLDSHQNFVIHVYGQLTPSPYIDLAQNQYILVGVEEGRQ